MIPKTSSIATLEGTNRSSLKVGRSRPSTATLDALRANLVASRRRPRKMVRFSNFLVTEHSIDLVPDQHFGDVFYGSIEIQDFRNQQILQMRAALANRQTEEDDLESDTMTWRGLEDLRDGTNKRHNSVEHQQHVLREWRFQREEKIVDVEELRRVSKDSSRRDGRAARDLGRMDAKAAGIEKATLVRRASGTLRSLSRNLSNNSITRNLSNASFKRVSSSPNSKKATNSPTRIQKVWSGSSLRKVSRHTSLQKSLLMQKALTASGFPNGVLVAS